MRRHIWMALLLVSCVGTAAASGLATVRKQVESTMLVEGTIDLDSQGRVEHYTLEHQEALPPAIVKMLARVLPQWRFEPVEVDGQATAVRSDMSLRLVAKKLDNGNFAVEIRGAHFGQDKPGESVSSAKLLPPRYPQVAVEMGAGGTVYLVLKIARDGRVQEAIAEQVNLRIIANERAMATLRTLLADAALKAAKRWTFTPPTRGEEVDAAFWSVRVPVDFFLMDDRRPKDHEWHAYVPGPRQPIPWRDDTSLSSAADALGAGGVYPLDTGLRLLTALDPG